MTEYPFDVPIVRVEIGDETYVCDDAEWELEVEHQHYNVGDLTDLREPTGTLRIIGDVMKVEEE